MSVSSLRSLQGFLMFQHLCTQGSYAVFWPDWLHKSARKSALALSDSGANLFLKKMNRLFRLTRGPWGTGRFGVQLKEARETLHSAIRENKVGNMLDAFLDGCGRDANRPAGSFHVQELLATLKSKAGRATLQILF